MFPTVIWKFGIVNQIIIFLSNKKLIEVIEVSMPANAIRKQLKNISKFAQLTTE